MLITPVIVAKRKNCRGKSVPNLDSEPEETVSEENLNKSTSLENLKETKVSQEKTKNEGDTKIDTLAIPGRNKKYEIKKARNLLLSIINVLLCPVHLIFQAF